MATRRRRANGEESRLRIIAAALEIAAERGYDGTSISAVSERSGLPPSSIYWHFQDKDDLIAAVIDHSYQQWLERVQSAPSKASDDTRAESVRSALDVQHAIADASDFLRLGLMLALERRPEEPAARAKFLKVRHEALQEAIDFYGQLYADRLTPKHVQMLAVMFMAMTDGLFIAQEIEGDDLPVKRLFELAGIAVDALARELITETPRPTRRR